jgi:predicted alpha-1,2-mannosidase
VHPVAALFTQTDGKTAFSTLYFHAEVGAVPTGRGTFQGRRRPDLYPGDVQVDGDWAGGWLDFDFEEPTTVEIRVGISHISVEQALDNLAYEVRTLDFDGVAAMADAEWNTKLNRVQIDADDTTKTVFYTGLYRSFFQPADYTEFGGRYAVSTSGETVVRQSDEHHYYTDDWCMWDTFRTSHPWRTLVEPDAVGDIATSMLTQYEEGGWLPKCTWNATGYSRVMTGNPAVSIIADAVVKGLTDFDTELAWQAVDHAGTADIDNLVDGLCGYVNLGTPPDYISLGYVPTECDPDQSVTMTLEYAYTDWAAARMAETLGRTDDAARYDARGNNWQNHWNPELGFMQPRTRAGDWVEPFDPANQDVFNDFVEGNSWIYTLFVPHDIAGLTETMGGEQAMVDYLDAFFANGQFNASNQPSFHIPWIYTIIGRPAESQARIWSDVLPEFTPEPDGLPGNDDAGSTSVWGLLATLGLYPIAPGDPTWTLTTPRVRSATIHLHPAHYDGGTLEIQTVGDPATMPFIASATWRGEPLLQAHLSHEQLVSGGVLSFVLSEAPTDWGTQSR